MGAFFWDFSHRGVPLEALLSSKLYPGRHNNRGAFYLEQSTWSTKASPRCHRKSANEKLQFLGTTICQDISPRGSAMHVIPALASVEPKTLAVPRPILKNETNDVLTPLLRSSNIKNISA